MRLLIAILMIVVAGSSLATEHEVVGPKGDTVGFILDCNSCKTPEEGGDCQSGVQEGYHDGKRCGQCLMSANFGTKLLYPYDLYFTGSLLQPDGTPLVNEFVRLHLPNTWTVRTRTTEKGVYRLVLGATQDREGSEVKLELGPNTRKKVDGATDYSLYMVPENYKPCPAQ